MPIACFRSGNTANMTELPNPSMPNDITPKIMVLNEMDVGLLAGTTDMELVLINASLSVRRVLTGFMHHYYLHLNFMGSQNLRILGIKALTRYSYIVIIRHRKGFS